MPLRPGQRDRGHLGQLSPYISVPAGSSNPLVYLEPPSSGKLLVAGEPLTTWLARAAVAALLCLLWSSAGCAAAKCPPAWTDSACIEEHGGYALLVAAGLVMAFALALRWWLGRGDDGGRP